ncbi:DNA repair protein RecO [Neolewinella antarctica]|uniref:DNA repair protein RecO n=1 Tax=Neolewinella antarctica TaxID=442734 RepID=A0ABX0XDC2_9BACT|nr:DNA repair protein RecO [Neolewinella antarctica]NJC27207.1 DNA repair protein RecO (recombination protein O) [Neolewinella antarctica]
MLIKTRGLIFRSTKYGDSSLILEVYTEQYGIRKYIVSGVRKARSSTPASLVQPMCLVDLVAYERPGKDLQRIKEVRPSHIYTKVPFDVFRGTIGLFMLEMTRNSIREAEENPTLFEYLHNAFVFLDETTGPIGNLHIHYLLGLTEYLGFIPSGEYSAETPLFDLKAGEFIAGFPGHTEYLEESKAKLMYELLHVLPNDLEHVKSTRDDRQSLLTDVVRYYRHHIEGMREINSLTVLRQVMS